jgi:predicted transcriptional regulator of viral defense system
MPPPRNGELVEVRLDSRAKARPVRDLAEIAADQDGVIGHDQLIALGFSIQWIKRKLADGWLHVVFRGAYAVGHRRISWQGRYRAALISCGPKAMLSHRSAVRWHNLKRWSGGDIHITVPGGGRLDRQEGIVVHRVRTVRPADSAVVDSLPVTSVARTLLDIAAIVRRETLDGLLEAADDADVLDPRKCDAVCGRGRSGSRALKEAILLYRPTPGWTRSRLEKYAYRLLTRDPDMPTPNVNNWIAGHEADLSYPDHGLIVEIDGGAVHGTKAAKERDPARDADWQLDGFEVFRATEHRLVYLPETVLEYVKRFLSRAGRTPARPGP